MRVLATGGAGFIGSHLCERLIEDGHRSAILDDLNPFYDPACKRRNLERVFERGEVRFHEGDIRDADLVWRIMADHRPQAVIHLAACAGVRLSMERPDLAIHKFASRMMAGLPVPVYGDGSSARDYTYVSDTAEGMIAALRHQTRFDSFNIGNGSPVGMRQLIGTLEEALGVRAEVHLVPEQPGDVPVTCADIRKARAWLGYDPRTPFRDGIDTFVGWLRQESAL